MTGVDAFTSIATYKHIKDMNLKTSVVYGKEEQELNTFKGFALI